MIPNFCEVCLSRLEPMERGICSSPSCQAEVRYGEAKAVSPKETMLGLLDAYLDNVQDHVNQHGWGDQDLGVFGRAVALKEALLMHPWDDCSSFSARFAALFPQHLRVGHHRIQALGKVFGSRVEQFPDSDSGARKRTYDANSSYAREDAKATERIYKLQVSSMYGKIGNTHYFDTETVYEDPPQPLGMPREPSSDLPGHAWSSPRDLPKTAAKVPSGDSWGRKRVDLAQQDRQEWDGVILNNALGTVYLLPPASSGRKRVRIRDLGQHPEGGPMGLFRVVPAGVDRINGSGYSYICNVPYGEVVLVAHEGGWRDLLVPSIPRIRETRFRQFRVLSGLKEVVRLRRCVYSSESTGGEVLSPGEEVLVGEIVRVALVEWCEVLTSRGVSRGWVRGDKLEPRDG
jgi:hypothetical protein